MPKTERRHPANARLREKINHIQVVSQQLLTLTDQVQKQTVAWARAGQVLDLPSAGLAVSLSDAFKEQRLAVSQIQQDITGAPTSIKSSPLITHAELAALMR